MSRSHGANLQMDTKGIAIVFFIPRKSSRKIGLPKRTGKVSCAHQTTQIQNQKKHRRLQKDQQAMTEL